MFKVPTSNPFKAVLPMSNKNDTDNPYQPPAPSDEPLAKKDATRALAKLNPVHWLVPIFGYAYLPTILINEAKLENYGLSLVNLSIFVPPIYVAAILLLGWQRYRQGTNTLVINLYHGLSLILPTWLFFKVLEGIS